jgi:site-specific DNA-methyltransferase (adenine-specific)
VAGHLVFAKGYSSKSSFVAYRHESTYLLVKGRPEFPATPLPDVLPWAYSGNLFHPTEKAVSTLSPLIKAFSNPDDTVLDPFSGSGSTCLAAHTLGRPFIGIELDPTYHALATKRLSTICGLRHQEAK